MKLYRPVLIESAEQAEALPEGTIATHPESLPIPIELSHDPDEGVNGYGIGTDLIWCEDLVGWTALVPIEAEEEWTAMGSDNGEPWIAHVGHDGIDGSREEAQQYVDRFGGFIAHRARTPWEEAQ